MIRSSILRFTAALVPMAAAASLAGAQAPAMPPAATLVAKYASTVGGPAFLAAKSIVTKGGMSMPAAGINATFELKQVANQMSMITEIPGMGKIEAGYDGTTAWSMDPMQGARVLAGAELDQIKDEANRRGVVRSPELFTSIETVADTTMNSERCFLVKLVWKSGREMWDCYSASSGLLVASRSTQKNPMGEIPVLTLFNDYKKFGDVMVATKMTQEAMGQQQILTVSSVVFGDGTEVVAPPPAVQALIKK
jgi:hypothetical protein